MDNNSIGLVPTDDQFFLLYFIIGMYFGPDILGEYPKKSVLQRKGLDLPPYTSNQLAGSCLRTVEVERVYYHALRKADQSVVLTQPWLHQFFHGRLPTLYHGQAAAYPRFCDLFPPSLHPHLCCHVYNVIANMVFINNPDTSYIEPDGIERFKKLTGVEHLIMDKDCTKDILQYASLVDSDEQFNNTSFTSLLKGICDGQFNSVPSRSIGQFHTTPFTDACGGPSSSMPLAGNCGLFSSNEQSNTALFSGLSKNAFDGGQFFKEPRGSPTKSDGNPFSSLLNSYMAPSSEKTNYEDVEYSIVFLPSRPCKKELSNIVAATKGGFAVTGSAAKSETGPVLGVLDVGESEDSYLFRVSLPGVKRDEDDFSCEVENDGGVLIEGTTTTGDRTVRKWSQVFRMQTQNLCPTGYFSISFKLPGPVNPQKFSGNFGTDGILEGFVMKADRG